VHGEWEYFHSPCLLPTVSLPKTSAYEWLMGPLGLEPRTKGFT
jgi:hypothetical protein